MSKNNQYPVARDSPKQVAVIVETTRAYGRRIIEGVARYVREHEPWLLHLEPRALIDPAPRWLDGWDGDGVIARVVDQSSIKRLSRLKIPLVNLKSGIGILGPAAVVTDQEAIGRLAAEHLLERGYRRFAFLGATGLSWSDERLRGFREAVAAYGYPCEEFRRARRLGRHSVEGAIGGETGSVVAWVNGLQKPIGLLAADDFLGLELLNACRMHDIAVPEQVAVIGVDNEESICKFSVPPLSSIIPDNVRMGYEAAAALARMMAGEASPAQPILVPPHGVVTRQSTDSVTIEDPYVAAAMMYIREHACRGLHVEDVVREVKISPASLQRRFQKTLGRSVYECILRIRLEQVKALLADTDLPLKGIAARTGFGYVEHLSALFKQRTGMTLGEFRERPQF